LVLHHNLATGATMALRSSVLHQHLPFALLNNYLHDYLLALQASASGTLGYIDECLIYYRVHEKQQVGLRKEYSLFRNFLYSSLMKAKYVFKIGEIRKEQIELARYLIKFTTNDFPKAKKFLEATTK